jgi:hypothetical protein
MRVSFCFYIIDAYDMSIWSERLRSNRANQQHGSLGYQVTLNLLSLNYGGLEPYVI